MNIPPASFRVTPYGEVDAEALERLHDDYDTIQLLRLVDGLDLLLKEMNNIGGLRDGLLRVHAMAKTVLDGAALSVSVTEGGSIWEEAESLDEDGVWGAMEPKTNVSSESHRKGAFRSPAHPPGITL
ncbi:Tn3 family transposase post-transcriptional regulator TnpC [Pseudomonas sp. 2023EL-01195]|uniref:Tn3 family transposase post-transcriptional regulator TnpC n=1 Tax=Pseudomonas sp. 2023EL-01195 TaxID=3088134 RepID=UPI00296AF44C|nr:Tn3 family transposase post-transcriptional regulator TnpC [Pseudomonas sp. 2023EL-01195]MDW3713281.1 Tn3 family transposase post-transcriptional regulator TnpC [Pseudomonas sp. 2023EL-01195]